LVQVLLFSAPVQVSTAASPAQKPAAPLVQAVMFWMESCGHCHYILEQVLPGLQSKYGDQLEIRLIELVSVTEVDLLYETAGAFGIPKEQVGVPFLVIGEHVLSGSVEIPEKLPGLIDAYLAAGGVGLTPALAASAVVAQATTLKNSSPILSGFGLATTVLVGMLGALVYSGISFSRMQKPARRSPSSAYAGTLTLTLVGLGIALYLAYVETQAIPAICGPVGDCNTVQSSSYARLFGFLPVALIGVAGYLTILAFLMYGKFSKSKLAALAPAAVFGLALFGSLFSMYLTYLELFVIKAVCSWCLATAVIMALLMLINLRPARRTFAKTSKSTRRAPAKRTL
jgi:uncharacterized membrane protein